MLKQAFACQSFKLCACFAVVGKRMNGDAAAWCEFADTSMYFGSSGDEVFHDDVDAVFMEVAVVAKAEEIEFQ